MVRCAVHVHRFRAPAVAELMASAASDPSPMPAAFVTIDDCTIRFETTCTPAHARLDALLATIFDSPYYAYAVHAEAAAPCPTLRYVDAPEYGASFDHDRDVCRFAGPWDEVGASTVLGMWLFYLTEFVRQRQGHYLLHASAVVRDGRAIVITGDGESGKTSMALDLCLHHGFRLFSNNTVKVAALPAGPAVLRGDPIFNFRRSSLRRYSPALADRVFGADAPGDDHWRVKRRVSPEQIGAAADRLPAPIATTVLLTLDDRTGAPSVQDILEGDATHEGFWAQANLYIELSSLIRGIRFVPLVGAAGFRNFTVPDLDCAAFAARRIAFLKALFESSRVACVRAPLDGAVAAALERFEVAAQA